MLAGLVASKNPTPALKVTARSLVEGGCDVVLVVNDGSDQEDSKLILREVEQITGVKVINLPKNVGKSAALREGFRSLPKNCVIVQTDDDTIAGDLTIPMQIITSGKADVVDIRIEISESNTVLGMSQEIGYWVLNAFVKKVQSTLQARTWLSGASIMYSHAAGVPILLEESRTMTEDTEGLYRALAKGFRVRYCSDTRAQFHTMAPQALPELYKQWRRWSIGNGQLVGMYREAGVRSTVMNAVTWMSMVAPIPTAAFHGITETVMWTFIGSTMFGLLCAIWMRRPLVIIGSVLLPFLAMMWTVQSFMGLFIAQRMGDKKEMTWVSPKRVAVN